MLSGEFEEFLSCFELPNEIHTFDGSQILKTIEDVRRVYDKVRSFYVLENVTDLVRRCVEAEFQDETTVSAVHESRLLSGDRQINEPFAVFSIIKFTVGGWKLVRSDYAVDHPPALIAALCQR